MVNRLHRKTAEMEYLLGALSEEEADRLEHGFFTDDEKFQELELAEDDLIDAYVRDELTAAEQQQFREKLMTIPRIVERVDFARALAESTSLPIPPPTVAAAEVSSGVQAKPKRRWWWKLFGSGLRLQPAFLACVVLIVIGGLALLAVWLRQRSQSARPPAEVAARPPEKAEPKKQSTEQPTKSEQQTAELPPHDQQRVEKKPDDRQLAQTNRRPLTPSFGSVFPLVVMPGGTRSVDASEEIVRDQSQVSTTVEARRIQDLSPKDTKAPTNKTPRVEAPPPELGLLLVKSGYPRYNVHIETPTEVTVFSRKGLTLAKGSSTLSIPIDARLRRLPPGDYIAYVDGVTPSGEVEEKVNYYHFRVTRKQTE